MRKSVILVFLMLILSLSALAYNTTVEVWTTVNITISYYGENTDSKVNISVNGIEKHYSLIENQTDTIDFNIPYTYICERSERCEEYLDYINESIGYAGLYADEKGKRVEAEQATIYQNERRKEAEEKIPELESKVSSLQGSYDKYKLEWGLCDKDFEYCNKSLTSTIEQLDEAEGERWSWGGAGAVLGAIGLFLWKFYKSKPRSPDKDMKEAPPAEEPV